ncbi:MAG: response regulator [Lachnospiraceae bacterium]|nr:response regulator [Lachnospiraceae bacterium]
MLNKKEKILIVDDAEVNRGILNEVFKDNYDVIEAENGQEALDILNEGHEDITIILLDLVMPVLNGFEFLEIINESGLIKKIPVILITGDYTMEAEKNGYNLGVSDIIIKPFNPEIVTKRVTNTIELYKHKNRLEKMVEEQTVKISEQAEILKKSNEMLIETLSTVVEFRNLESGAHIRHIKSVVATLLKYLRRDYPEYKLTDKDEVDIITASAMHDIGKIAISDTILLKPGRLTPEEFEIMKTHTIKGCEILDQFEFIYDDNLFKVIYDICRYHHEKYDGRGYPDGLEGEDIPIWAQIVSVADVYEALVSKRVYKDAFAHDTAINMIKNGECGAFSEKMMDCLDKAGNELNGIIKARRD